MGDLEAPQPFLHLVRAANRYPNRRAVVGLDAELTYQELAVHASRLAVVLADRGVVAGDVVATALDPITSVVALYALFALRAVSTVVPNLARDAHNVRINWVLAPPDVPVPTALRRIDADDAFWQSVAGVTESLDVEPYASFDDPIRIAFSSGSTGVPRAIAISTTVAEARRTVFEKRWMVHEPVLSLIPLSSTIGLNCALSCAAGAVPYFVINDCTRGAELVNREWIGGLLGSPAQLRVLTSSSAEKMPNLFGTAITGGAADVELIAALWERAGDNMESITSLYGSTETGTILQGEVDDDGSARYRVTDLAEVMLDERGCLAIKSVLASPGYVGEDARDGGGFDDDGWFHTDDLAEISDGYVRLLGRTGHVVNIGGMKFDLDALESSLRHRVAGDLCVVNVGSTLVVATDTSVDPSTLGEAWRDLTGLSQLAHVRFDVVPRSPNGKPDFDSIQRAATS